MSAHLPPPNPAPAPARAAPVWTDPAREAAFQRWLDRESAGHGLVAGSVRPASADASFRRYFRVDRADGAGSCIIMDAPPAQENCAPFVHVAALMLAAGLNVPRILAWDAPQGFMLLSDLGAKTMMETIDREHPGSNAPLYGQAIDALITWQLASKPGVLPPYDDALLRRELSLFPDWYLAKHRGVAVEGAIRETLDKTFDAIVTRNLAAPSVYVHRDFMPRNLMAPAAGDTPVTQLGGTAETRLGRSPETRLGESLETRLGVLDFQDAVYGPVTYDIASLMRDAFLSWDEDFVLDVTIRYWEKARKAGLMDFEDWHRDFGAFYRAVQWMGLQRHLKVAGIFARLTLRDGKPRYLADTPRFIGYIRATAGR
ncbi:MAG TPA: phosphotransferase, partial [Thermomonas sp.]|nr:phosphotransferase [Thermomonas sp.]